jgi:hypothetical protein
MNQYSLDELQAALDARKRELQPTVAVSPEQLNGLGAATYWLASLHRRGAGVMPTGLDAGVAAKAHLLRASLRLTPAPKLVAAWPFIPPWEAVFDFVDMETANKAAQYLCYFGAVRIRDTRVRVERAM